MNLTNGDLVGVGNKRNYKRWFIDVEPESDGVIIKIQKSRKDSIQTIQIKKDQKILEFTKLFKTAYKNIY